ncbi:small ribosomal subunit protein eS17-like [Eulemur rufifrons]|uniref:small ribosomal subunit protein eS17-like n=1 Tax=Eulemur rufifrons TaxID=859984 RepID=UPI00374473DF
MDCIHTKTVKKAARVIIEKNYMHMGNDFHRNKHMCRNVAIIPSNKLSNKIAGYVTHLMKWIQRGSESPIERCLHQAVGGRERRDRRDKCVPEVSALAQEIIEVDLDTKEILKLLNFGSLSNLQVIRLQLG